VVVDEPEMVAEQPPKPKRARDEGQTSHLPGLSSSDDIWVPEMTVGYKPLTVHDTVLDNANVEHSAKVGHALTSAACLPGDLQACEDMSMGKLVRHISRGLAMVSFLF
jgi:hypothetical protein